MAIDITILFSYHESQLAFLSFPQVRSSGKISISNVLDIVRCDVIFGETSLVHIYEDFQKFVM